MTHRRMLTALLACAVAALPGCRSDRATAPHPLLASISSSPPTELTGHAASPTQVDLSWTDNSTNESGFEIQRATGSGGTFAWLANVGANVTAYGDRTVAAGTTYCYRVRAYRERSRTAYSTFSNTFCVTTPSPPAAPTGVRAEVIDVGSVRISWQPSAGATSYHIERSATPEGPWAHLVTLGASPHTDAGLSQEVQVCYRVTAANSWGQAASTASCTTPPAMPTNLSASTPAGGGISLAWTDNSSVESGFEIQRARSDLAFTSLATVGVNATAYHDATVAGDTRYWYRVRALRDVGHSAFSNWADAVVTSTVPTAPSSVRALPMSSTDVYVDWRDASDNESGFRVERSPTGEAPWTTAGSTSAGQTAVYESDRVPDERICYRVLAFNSFGDSPPSPTACAIPLKAPTALTATSVEGGSIDLNWQDESAYEAGYEIRRKYCTEPGYGYYGYYPGYCWMNPIATVAAGVTTWRDSDVAAGVEYTYEVVAFQLTPEGGRYGYSSPSAQASATPGP